MIDNRHIEFMRTAIKLARYALDHGETPVACIFVHEPTDTIVAYGMNDTNRSLTGIAHAEFMGIRQIQENAGGNCDDDDGAKFSLLELMREIVVYVTVEPCIMCASALKQLGVRKVYFGCANERFGGNGTVFRVNTDSSTLRTVISESNETGPTGETGETGGYVAVPGLFRREAIMLLRYFYVRENTHAPQPRSKAERTLDVETFPTMEWKRYLDRATFVKEYGSEEVNHNHYDSGTDIPLKKKTTGAPAAVVVVEVDWDLIDNHYDDIINILDEQIRHFVAVQSKKRKVCT